MAEAKIEQWMWIAARGLVEANADIGRTFDNRPNVEETAKIIAADYWAAHAPQPQQAEAPTRKCACGSTESTHICLGGNQAAPVRDVEELRRAAEEKVEEAYDEWRKERGHYVASFKEAFVSGYLAGSQNAAAPKEGK